MSFSPECQEFLDQFYSQVTPAMYERLKTAASRGDVSTLLRAYVDECEDYNGIGPHSAVRAAESSLLFDAMKDDDLYAGQLEEIRKVLGAAVAEESH